MIPQFMPTYRFSALWPTFAIRTGSHVIPAAPQKARAVASSSAAEEDSPAPMGTSPSTTASSPGKVRSSSASAQAMPAT